MNRLISLDNFSPDARPCCFLVSRFFKSSTRLIITSVPYHSIFWDSTYLLFFHFLLRVYPSPLLSSLLLSFSSGHSEQSNRYFPTILCEDHKAPPGERLRRRERRPLIQLSALLPAHPLWSRHQVCLEG